MSCLCFSEASCERNLDNLIESLSAMETSTKPQTAGQRDGGQESDLSMPPLEEELEDGVGVATEHDEMKENHDEVGVATDGYDEDLSHEEQGGNTDEEGVAKMCSNELGVGLRRRNRCD